MYRKYQITIVSSGKTKIAKTRKFAHDAVAKLYPDIGRGEYYLPNTMRFYSQKHGYILAKWE